MPDGDAELLCPQCGYDLRGIASERCPECGAAVDRDSVASRLPWTFRGNGRVRAYAATVRLVTLRPKLLTAELARPVAYRDARRFWVVTSTILSLPTLAMATLLVLAAVENKGGRGFDGFITIPQAWQRMIVWDGYAPLVSGWMFTPLTAGFVIAATFASGRVLPWLVNRPALPPSRRARAVALAHYVVGTMAWWPLGLLIAALAARATYAVGGPPMRAWYTLGERIDAADRAIIVFALGLLVSTGGTLLLTVVRAAGLYRAVHHGGVGRWLAGATLVPLGVAGVWAFWLSAVPWTIGLIWLLWRGLS